MAGCLLPSAAGPAGLLCGASDAGEVAAHVGPATHSNERISKMAKERTRSAGLIATATRLDEGLSAKRSDQATAMQRFDLQQA